MKPPQKNMTVCLKPYAHNQASSFGLGNQTTTTGSVSTPPLYLSFFQKRQVIIQC